MALTPKEGLYVLFAAVMLAWSAGSSYHEWRILSRKRLLVVRLGKGWLIYLGFFSAVLFFAATMFLAGGVVSLSRHWEVGAAGWFIITSAVICFGKLSFNFSPWMAKVVFTEGGVVSPFGSVEWRWLTKYEWADTFGKNACGLIVHARYLGIRVPVPLKLITADPRLKGAIDKILEDNAAGLGHNRAC